MPCRVGTLCGLRLHSYYNAGGSSAYLPHAHSLYGPARQVHTDLPSKLRHASKRKLAAFSIEPSPPIPTLYITKDSQQLAPPHTWPIPFHDQHRYALRITCKIIREMIAGRWGRSSPSSRGNDARGETQVRPLFERARDVWSRWSLAWQNSIVPAGPDPPYSHGPLIEGSRPSKQAYRLLSHLAVHACLRQGRPSEAARYVRDMLESAQFSDFPERIVRVHPRTLMLTFKALCDAVMSPTVLRKGRSHRPLSTTPLKADSSFELVLDVNDVRSLLLKEALSIYFLAPQRAFLTSHPGQNLEFLRSQDMFMSMVRACVRHEEWRIAALFIGKVARDYQVISSATDESPTDADLWISHLKRENIRPTPLALSSLVLSLQALLQAILRRLHSDEMGKADLKSVFAEKLPPSNSTQTPKPDNPSISPPPAPQQEQSKVNREQLNTARYSEASEAVGILASLLRLHLLPVPEAEGKPCEIYALVNILFLFLRVESWIQPTGELIRTEIWVLTPRGPVFTSAYRHVVETLIHLIEGLDPAAEIRYTWRTLASLRKHVKESWCQITRTKNTEERDHLVTRISECMARQYVNPDATADEIEKMYEIPQKRMADSVFKTPISSAQSLDDEAVTPSQQPATTPPLPEFSFKKLAEAWHGVSLPNGALADLDDLGDLANTKRKRPNTSKKRRKAKQGDQ